VVDPVSISVLGGVALSEGIKFLYGQVSELLRRRRDRLEQAASRPLTVPAEQPAALDGPMVPGPVDLSVVDSHEDQVLALASGLSNYANGLVAVDPADPRLVEQVTALRGLLELAYGQHLTFRGEQRPATGSPLPAEAPASVASYVATVNVSGAGAVGLGRDNTGTITTSVHNPGPASPVSPEPR
jgi:hypothetical protein